MPTQPLGWFKKPITKADDFKGLKYRTVGISIDMFTGMGAAVNALPGGEIVPAMDRGLLDAAEFNNTRSDRLLGFPDVSKVCMLQSYHQNAEQFEIMFNKTKYDALPDKMKAIIANAVEAASQDMTWKAIDRYSKDYVELQTKDKVKFYKTPDAILQKQLEILRPGRREEVGGQCDVQGNHRVAEGVRRARGEVGPRHQRQPAHGVQPLLRRQEGRRTEEGLTRHVLDAKHHPADPGWCFFWRVGEPCADRQRTSAARIAEGLDHAETAAVRRQGEHLGRPGVLLAHRRRSRCSSRGRCSRATRSTIRTRGRST